MWTLKIGGRILKTGVAVGLALYASHLLHLDPIIFAGIAAAISVQPSLYRSWRNSLEQVQANVVGAIVGIALAVLLGTAPHVIALGIIIVISINLQLKFDRSIPLAMVTVLAIMGSPQDSFWEVAGDRFLLIFIGVLSSITTNVLFPPRHEKRLLRKLYELHENIVLYFRLLTDADRENVRIRKDLEQLSKEMDELYQLYELHVEENRYARRLLSRRTRKLVVLRKMVDTCKKGIETLQQLDKQLTTIGEHEDVRQLISDELQKLALFQEKVFLKFSGKIKHSYPVHETTAHEEPILSVKKTFRQFKENENVLLFLLPIVQQLNDMYEELVDLDRTVEQYYQSHQE